MRKPTQEGAIEARRETALEKSMKDCHGSGFDGAWACIFGQLGQGPAFWPPFPKKRVQYSSFPFHFLSSKAAGSFVRVATIDAIAMAAFATGGRLDSGRADKFIGRMADRA